MAKVKSALVIVLVAAVQVGVWLYLSGVAEAGLSWSGKD